MNTGTVELIKRKFSTLLAAGIAALMVVGVALPAYNDHVARNNLSAAIAYSETGRLALEAACSGGRFDSVQAPSDLRLKPPEPGAFVLRTEIAHSEPEKILLTLVLDDYGVAWSSINQWKRNLIFEHTCTAQKKLSSRLSPKTTVDSLHIPTRFRS